MDIGFFYLLLYCFGVGAYILMYLLPAFVSVTMGDISAVDSFVNNLYLFWLYVFVLVGGGAHQVQKTSLMKALAKAFVYATAVFIFCVAIFWLLCPDENVKFAVRDALIDRWLF